MQSESPATLPDHCQGEVLSSERPAMMTGGKICSLSLDSRMTQNVLCRKSDAAKVEEITVQTLSEVGEEAHPGKTERMVAGVRDDELPEGFSAAVRFLGPWTDMNGGCVTGTAMRLERAREVWRKVKVKLPRLGVGLRTKARVVQATVIAALLFGSEVRTFSRTDIEKY